MPFCRLAGGWIVGSVDELGGMRGVHAIVQPSARLRIDGRVTDAAVLVTFEKEGSGHFWIVPRVWIGEAVGTSQFVGAYGNVPFCRLAGGLRGDVCCGRSWRGCWMRS